MKCCVGISLLLLVSGVLIEPGAALAESLAVIGRDGVFVAYADGVEANTRTGLGWIAGPDVDTTRTRRFTFLEEGRLVTITVGYHLLSGGGMGPRLDRRRRRMANAHGQRTLHPLPKARRTVQHYPLLITRGIHVWPHQDDEDRSLYRFGYMDPYGTRGFAVRSAVSY